MKVVVVEGDEEEVSRVLRELEREHEQEQEKAATVVRAIRARRKRAREEEEEEPRRYEKRTPRRSPKSHYTVVEKAPPRYGGHKWSRDERGRLRAFYRAPENHYSNGYMIPEKVIRFARTLRRTPMAVSVAVILFGLNRVRVRGDKKWRRGWHGKAKHDAAPDTMLRRKAKAPFDIEIARKKAFHDAEKKRKVERQVSEAWPALEGVAVSQDIVTSTFKLFTLGDRQREMTFSQDGYTYGIFELKVWDRFLLSVMKNAGRICGYLGVPNRFRLAIVGKARVLRYG